MKKWKELPAEMQIEEVKFYYDILKKKQISLVLKRTFDVVISIIMLIFLAPIFLILAIAIKVDSSGPVFYRQERVTRYGKKFRIHKFRTMVTDADKIGSMVTVKDDKRITRVGTFIRKYRLDEISQLIDILWGDMTFVGTRPEVPKYVNQYKPEMLATLLLPAGVTSETSILYKDEERLLNGVEDVDDAYVKDILPQKMYYNLKSIEQFGFWRDIMTLFKTVVIVFGRSKNQYEGNHINN